MNQGSGLGFSARRPRTLLMFGAPGSPSVRPEPLGILWYPTM